MMKFKKTAIAVCVAMGMATRMLHANQQKSGSPMASDCQSESRYLDSHSTALGKLKGKEIVNAAGDEIGEVDNVVRGVSDREEHTIVSVGEFLGIGEKAGNHLIKGHALVGR